MNIKKKIDEMIKKQIKEVSGERHIRVANVDIRYDEVDDTIYFKIGGTEIGMNGDVWIPVVKETNRLIKGI